MATIAKVWYCLDCDTQLTESETHIHECVGEDIPFMIEQNNERTVNDLVKEIAENAQL